MSLTKFDRTIICLLLIRIGQFVCVGTWMWFWLTPDEPNYRMIAGAFVVQAALAEVVGDYRVKLNELNK